MARRNKFLNRRVKVQAEEAFLPKVRQTSEDSSGRRLDVLKQFEACWNSLDTARAKLRRSIMYAYEDQWGDMVKDPITGEQITEGELIKKEGKVPLKNNMISPILKNIDGQFRNGINEPICSVRDQSEAKVGEMMTIAVQYVHDINMMDELDSDSLRMVLLGGFAAQRTEYGWNNVKRQTDVWTYPVEPERMFFNTDIEDPRTWDLNCIGELYDLPLEDIIAVFAKNESDKKKIENFYGQETLYNWDKDGLQGEQLKNVTFYNPYNTDTHRVIFGWRLESRDAYYYNDTLKGTWGYFGKEEKADIDMENKHRTDEAMAMGVEPDDILLIEYEFRVERYWKYYYLTPWGDVLQEGRSPYWHHSHNYTLVAYPMVAGKVFNFVEDFIDQQRVINRTVMLIDFIRSSSSKGLMIVDDTAFSDMTREEIVDEFVRYNGVLFARLKPGQNINNVVTQLNGSGAVAGDYELLQLQLKLINEISGVNSAMQGQGATSGTAASLYALQVQNSSLNLKGLFETFNNFRRRRDTKVMQTIQQFYTSAKHLDLSGTNYSEESQYYNPDKVQAAEIDLKMSDTGHSQSYKDMINEMLMNLFRMQAIDISTMLENSTFPFKDKILESLKRQQEAMQQGQMAQVQMPESQTDLMGRALNDGNAEIGDGIAHRVVQVPQQQN